jgi:hypothetical protein
MRQTDPGRARSPSPRVARASRGTSTSSQSLSHVVHGAARPLASVDLLTLQRLAGNSAVQGLIAQRAAAAGTAKKRGKPATPESYADLLVGINHIAMAAAQDHGAGVADVPLGSHLSATHRDLLAKLRSAVMMAYSSKSGEHQAALNVWTFIQPDLASAVKHAPEFVEGDVGGIQHDLSWLDEQLIRPAAYREAHAESVAHTSLKTPDLAFQQRQLEEAEIELEQAKGFAEDAAKIISMGASSAILKDTDLGKEIFELVSIKGTIQEKLEKAKEKGIVEQTATAVELVGKIAGLKNTIIQTTMEVLKHRAEKFAEKALEEGARQLAKHWKEIAEGYEKNIQSLKVLGKVLGMVGVLADAIRAFKAALDGDWEGALKNAASAGMGVLGALGVEGGGPLLAGITITIKAEIEAIHLAAEFTRWCKEETVRVAASSFIDACSLVARNVAYDFVADVDLMLTSGNAAVSQMAGQQMMARVGKMNQGLAYLRARAAMSQAKWPGLFATMDAQAQRALTNPFNPDDPLSLAQELSTIFEGANAMATYVKEHYPTDPELAARAKEESNDEGGESDEE